jgi:hypothetical protein
MGRYINVVIHPNSKEIGYSHNQSYKKFEELMVQETKEKSPDASRSIKMYYFLQGFRSGLEHGIDGATNVVKSVKKKV